MHERFNFYDVYVYLIPGLTLLGLAWLPYGAFASAWPEAALLSTVAVLFAGYVLGHLLSEAARRLPVFELNPQPSNRLLMEGAGAKEGTEGKKRKEMSLSPELRTRFWRLLQARFGIERPTPDNTDFEVPFMLARSVALRESGPAYFEQFQGLYGLMRGLAAAFSLAAVVYLGWAAMAGEWDWRLVPLIGAVAIGALWWLAALRVPARTDGLARRLKGLWWVALILVFAFALGAWMAHEAQPFREHGLASFLAPILAAVLLLLFALQCRASHRYYASHFAKSVYVAFCSLPDPGPPGSTNA